MGEWKRVICCHCPMACGLLAHVDGNRVVALTGNPQHPVSRGFICIKGERAHEYHKHPGRLTVPLKRVGRRGEGRWARISWEHAMDEIAEKLQRVRDRYGPESVAFAHGTFHGPECGIGLRFLNLFGSPNSSGMGIPCAGPALEAESLTYGFGPTYVSPPVPGVTRCVVIWGSRPSASQPPVWPALLECQKAGAKLIVIDPLRTEEAERADLWLQVRPGSDGALALAWLHVIIEEGLYDREFVAQWGYGFEELRERVRDYSPERVAPITWIPPERIVEAARLYATHQPALLIWGVANAQLGRTALQVERAKAILRALTGSLDRPGGTLLMGPPSRALIMQDMEMYDSLPLEQRRKKLGAARFRLHGEGYDLLCRAMERVWGKKRMISQLWGADVPSPLLWRAILTGKPYPIKAVLIQYHNPLGACAHGRVVYDALVSENLELSVVHELFMTPTAELADYVLPACHWLEKSALVTFFGWAPVVLAGEQAVVPTGERHNDYELWRDLGWRLGQQAYWPKTLEDFWSEMLRPSGLSFPELIARPDPWILDPPRFLKYAEQDPQTGRPRGFGTPTGKVEFFSTILEQLGYDPLPAYEEVPEIDDPLLQQEYPLLLITGGTVIESHHQGMRQVRFFRERYPHPQVWIHPETAARLGICEGDWVYIETPRGRICQQARLTDRIHPLVVQADRWYYPEEPGEDPRLHGFWEVNVNVVTDDEPEHSDPAYGAWRLRANRCRISRAEEPPWGARSHPI
jgi:thiosulfate reductase/polysulfide reductase chain A